jgi:hypothetical protein
VGTQSELPPQGYWQPSPPVARQGNGLAITAIVIAGIALLMGLGGFVLPLIAGGVFALASSGSAGPFGTPSLEGTAPQVVAGQAYPGRLLQEEVARVEGGSGPGGPSYSCPETAAVVAGTVTICHEAGGGPGSSVKVTFEDDLGHFRVEWD